ncbi:unnamed protein product [Bursaphelenchus okinawaensis]|uniref:Uncharacterized protein n=1 Tax=Bursaphelenchus okinawaensis TaxID=465554 RepID=A0A811KSP6_9BILA|nr:unnamed protein product [Bursaphelenchus okinawaensis]CAG9109910.1 unnamed protein product [Bursaphelenchus okinawaensis]
MMLLRSAVLLSLFGHAVAIWPFNSNYQKAVSYKGRVLCGGKVYSNVKIELWEDDVFQDDFVSSSSPNKDGWYYIGGLCIDGPFEWEVEPYLIMYHRCNEHKECYYFDSWQCENIHELNNQGYMHDGSKCFEKDYAATT